VWLGEDRLDRAARITDAYDERRRAANSQRAIEEPSAIAESIALRIKADEWREHDLRRDFETVGRVGNPPQTVGQPRTGAPLAERERLPVR
jgi:hypothetical protein